jgi:hypothetical protein
MSATRFGVKAGPGISAGKVGDQKKLVIWVRRALTTTDEGEKSSAKS